MGWEVGGRKGRRARVQFWKHLFRIPAKGTSLVAHWSPEFWNFTFQCRSEGLISAWGARILHASQQKTQNNAYKANNVVTNSIKTLKMVHIKKIFRNNRMSTRYPSGDVNGKLGIYFGVWDRHLIWESYIWSIGHEMNEVIKGKSVIREEN